jgi:hypothetical protein
MKYPLKATLRTVTVSIGENPVEHDLQPATGFDPYGGEQLNVNASIAGNVLNVEIGNGVGNNPIPAGDANAVTTAHIVFTYARTNGTQKTETWDIQNVSYGGNELIVSGTVTGIIPGGDVALTVSDGGPAAAAADQIGYILVQRNVGAAVPVYDLAWLEPAINVPDHTLVTTSEIVAPIETNGGMSGPMGIQVP